MDKKETFKENVKKDNETPVEPKTSFEPKTSEEPNNTSTSTYIFVIFVFMLLGFLIYKIFPKKVTPPASEIIIESVEEAPAIPELLELEVVPVPVPEEEVEEEEIIDPNA